MHKIIKIVVSISLFVWHSSNVNATTYYVSNSGNDANTGTATNQSWSSLGQVNGFAFQPGDSILFNRGDEWNGQLLPKSGNSTSRIYYGAYGAGTLPAIMGSVQRNNAANWIDQGGNVWLCDTNFSTDIGNIILDDGVAVGLKKWGLADLNAQNDFWYNINTGSLFIYSVGNPATIYSAIDLAVRQHVVDFSATQYVTFENLAIKYGAAHGFGGSPTSNLIIRSCEISYIGGGDLNMDATVRFGNAVEFWGNATDNLVEKCLIWEIYDTGLTNQNHTQTVTQSNISYRNNIIWNCGLASFEFWVKPASSTVSNIRFENNTCYNAGGGWGVQRPDISGLHVVVSDNLAQTDTVFIQNNIFHTAQRSIYVEVDVATGQYVYNHNVVFQPNAGDTLFAYYPSLNVFHFSEFNNYVSTTGYGQNSIAADPNLVDIANQNFMLAWNSPAIDAGANLNITEDFAGNNRPQNAGIDIGAYEYLGGLNVLENQMDQKLLLFPNPCRDHFYIEMANEKLDKMDVLILNQMGQVVMRKHDFDLNNPVNISELKPGVYWVNISNQKSYSLVKKLVVQ
ncbi:MAG: T9SS type A sorting domain-containing protein [Crocinitomicaceae bacterium]|nr:T9SS type A sorting domain-containing protein [Crocinitomicaceae bacterium]